MTSRDPLAGLDLEDWVSRFDVRFVPSDVLEDRFAAIHQLTTRGKQLQLGEWDILVDDRLEEFVDILRLHEAVENHLRRHAWTYPKSHKYAQKIEKEVFGGTDLYERYRDAVDCEH